MFVDHLGCSWHLPGARFFHFLSSQREFQFNSVVEKCWCWVRLMVHFLSNHMAHTNQTGEDMVLTEPTSQPTSSPLPIFHRLRKLRGWGCFGGNSLPVLWSIHLVHWWLVQFSPFVLGFLLQKQVTRRFRTCPKCSAMWKPSNRRRLFWKNKWFLSRRTLRSLNRIHLNRCRYFSSCPKCWFLLLEDIPGSSPKDRSVPWCLCFKSPVEGWDKGTATSLVFDLSFLF